MQDSMCPTRWWTLRLQISSPPNAARFDSSILVWWRSETLVMCNKSIEPVCIESFLEAVWIFDWLVKKVQGVDKRTKVWYSSSLDHVSGRVDKRVISFMSGATRNASGKSCNEDERFFFWNAAWNLFMTARWAPLTRVRGWFVVLFFKCLFSSRMQLLCSDTGDVCYHQKRKNSCQGWLCVACNEKTLEPHLRFEVEINVGQNKMRWKC